MVGKNESIFIGKLVAKPKLSENGQGSIARASIKVVTRSKTGSNDNVNVVPIVAFHDSAKALENIGYTGARIYAECRVEMIQRKICNQTAIVPSFVVNRFTIFSPPKRFERQV